MCALRVAMVPIGPNKPYSSVLVPTGSLGIGVNPKSVARGLAMGVDAIACDAGSTDSGPSYLARGVAKYSRHSVKSDMTILMAAAREAGVPLLIGSCGTCGTDSGVDWMHEIVSEISRELNYSPVVTLLYSEQSKDVLHEKLAQGKIGALAPTEPLTTEKIDSCDHIVALMGIEPYIEAVRSGADIILGGRTTDTAVLAAVPLMLGAGSGPAWHAAKIAECGALCAVNQGADGIIMRVSQSDFEIEPASAKNSCTPYTVSSHMLYENSDPYTLVEPGGVLDVHNAIYQSADERTVRVTGSAWQPKQYTMKLEGAGAGPYQTLMLIGIQDPKVLANLEAFQERMVPKLHKRIDKTLGLPQSDYDISLRVYGWNALTGTKVPEDAVPPREVGVLFVATAATQELATLIAKTCNPHFFHFPLEASMELPSYGFPFTPAEVERGRVYTFHLNHVVEVQDGLELVRSVTNQTVQQEMEIEIA